MLPLVRLTNSECSSESRPGGMVLRQEGGGSDSAAEGYQHGKLLLCLQGLAAACYTGNGCVHGVCVRCLGTQ